MAQPFEMLFSPFHLKRLTLRNRVVWLPHLTCYAHDFLPSEQHAYYYAERAKGGAALIIAGSDNANPTYLIPAYIAVQKSLFRN